MLQQLHSQKSDHSGLLVILRKLSSTNKYKSMEKQVIGRVIELLRSHPVSTKTAFSYLHFLQTCQLLDDAGGGEVASVHRLIQLMLAQAHSKHITSSSFLCNKQHDAIASSMNDIFAVKLEQYLRNFEKANMSAIEAVSTSWQGGLFDSHHLHQQQQDGLVQSSSMTAGSKELAGSPQLITKLVSYLVHAKLAAGCDHQLHEDDEVDDESELPPQLIAQLTQMKKNLSHTA